MSSGNRQAKVKDVVVDSAVKVKQIINEDNPAYSTVDAADSADDTEETAEDAAAEEAADEEPAEDAQQKGKLGSCGRYRGCCEKGC
jgi:hypothetical protein